MLTDTERAAIVEAMNGAPEPSAVALDALLRVQQRTKWISDEILSEVAALLGMSVHELDGIVTFYDRIYRRPVGRHLILMCDGVICWTRGYERLYAHLQEHWGLEFGRTSEDGRFTLLPASCLGQCECAPAMIIDDEPHTSLDAQRLREILERYP